MQVNTPRDDQISIDEQKQFVSENTVFPGEKGEAYVITGPDNYVLGVDAGTNFAPEFYDMNGDKLGPSVRVTIQKQDRQGNPIGDALVLSERMDGFDYSKQRSDPDFQRTTNQKLMIDEHEHVAIYLDMPQSANQFEPSKSRFSIGDSTTDFGKPVEVVSHDSLSEADSKAVKKAAQGGGQ